MACVITRGTSENLTSLVKEIEKAVAANKKKKMCAFVVWLTDDPDETEKALEKFAKDNKIKATPLTLIEGVAGPPRYKIHKDAEVTVMLWVKGRVEVNHAFGKDELTEKAVKTVVADLDKILGKKS